MRVEFIKMNKRVFTALLAIIALGFTVAFSIIVVPHLIQSLDLVGAIAAGFVNPYASGFALDTLTSWLVLTLWILYEAKNKNIKYGWIAILLGLIPGTATGFACYLLLRTSQES